MHMQQMQFYKVPKAHRLVHHLWVGNICQAMRNKGALVCGLRLLGRLGRSGLAVLHDALQRRLRGTLRLQGVKAFRISS